MQNVIRSGEFVVQAKPWAVIGQYTPSLMDSLFPSLNTVQRLAISLFFVGLLVAFGRATFYLPDNPVPSHVSDHWRAADWRFPRAAMGPLRHPRLLPPGHGRCAGVQRRRKWLAHRRWLALGQRLGLCDRLPDRRLPDRVRRRRRVGGLSVPARLEPGPLPVAHAPGESLHIRPGPPMAPLLRPSAGRQKESCSAAECTILSLGDLVKLMIAALVVGFGWKLADKRQQP